MLHARLGVEKEAFGEIPSLQGPALPDPDMLFDQVFEQIKLGSFDKARLLLGAALLSSARKTTEGRLCSSLVLISRLVVHADPNALFGDEYAQERDRMLPNGWRHGTASWSRLRYAWRDGMASLLGAEGSIEAQTLDELTRLSPNEPEPVSVNIQEQYPAPETAFYVTMGGLLLSVYGVYATYRHQDKMETQMAVLRRRKGR